MRRFAFLLFVIVISNLSMACYADDIKWIDPGDNKEISVNGLPWFEQNNHKFIRLPLSEKDSIGVDAWRESLRPSSARIRFKTDSTSLQLKIRHYVKKSNRLAMYHMSSVAVSGVDLYMRTDDGQMSFWKTTHPKSADHDYVHVYFKDLPAKMREFTLYLPSYNELADLKIGVDEHAVIKEPVAYKIVKPIVFYGTSITQSGCASRGSNGFVPIVERRMDADVVNLGFSGSGKAEPIMAKLISKIDASVYVIDCVANINAKLMNERYEKFVRILRKSRPEIPVLLMTKTHYADDMFPEYAKEYDLQNKPLYNTYNKLKAEGDNKVYLFDAGAIIKPFGDHPSVDGVHLTDRGFYMISDELVPVLQKIVDSSIHQK